MEIISMSAIKGGVGKSTLAFNYAEYLANLNKKVLLVDMDHQCNLSQIYNVYKQTNTVASVLTGEEEVGIINVSKNVDLIPGYMELDKIEKYINSDHDKDMKLYLWIIDNNDKYDLESYDYMVIDTHPDFSEAARNAIAVADKIISPEKPSGFTEDSETNIKLRIEKFKQELVDFRSRESYVKGNIYFVGNMVKHNTKSSREFKEKMKSSKDYVTYFPDKEIISSSIYEKIPVVKYMENKQFYNKHAKFFDNFIKSCELITNIK